MTTISTDSEPSAEDAESLVFVAPVKAGDDICTCAGTDESRNISLSISRFMSVASGPHDTFKREILIRLGDYSGNYWDELANYLDESSSTSCCYSNNYGKKSGVGTMTVPKSNDDHDRRRES